MPKKYEGLDGTELAISESQERMAVRRRRLRTWTSSWRYAREENLEATVVAEVTDDAARARCMWNDSAIIDLSPRVPGKPTARPKQQAVHVGQAGAYERTWDRRHRLRSA